MISVLSLALLALAAPVPNASSQAASSAQPRIDFAQRQSEPVCYKMRSYIFERNDDAAPKLVRETTCSSARPRLNRSKMPKARVIPAN